LRLLRACAGFALQPRRPPNGSVAHVRWHGSS
jgi:hypothetical protein